MGVEPFSFVNEASIDELRKCLPEARTPQISLHLIDSETLSPKTGRGVLLFYIRAVPLNVAASRRPLQSAALIKLFASVVIGMCRAFAS
ncbi:MAG TPA: hypothetical protein VGQ82_11320 [Chthoniobacterales bacterium]|nr:hypothetical protein [Chthoniobacterales bacterium]